MPPSHPLRPAVLEIGRWGDWEEGRSFNLKVFLESDVHGRKFGFNFVSNPLEL